MPICSPSAGFHQAAPGVPPPEPRPDRSAARLPRAHLYRVFAGQGETVSDQVREVRLQRARDLLTDAAERYTRIGDVAYRCDFHDPVHFARVLRRRFGITPSELKTSGDHTQN